LSRCFFSIGKTTESIEKRAVRVGVDQSAVVVLAVDFDEKLASLAHQLHGDRLVVDIGLGAAIRRLHPAENQVAIVVDTVLANEKPGRMAHTDIEDRRHLPFVAAMADKRTVATAAKGQRQAIEKDGFSSPGFAGQHGKTGIERQIKPFDQDDIADRNL
jgi:hypothetical protein